MFVLDSEVTGEVLENGVVRKVKGYLDDLMLVELHWKAGQEGALHTHPHRQCTYVLSGAFESNVEGAKQVLRAGDCVYTAGLYPCARGFSEITALKFEKFQKRSLQIAGNALCLL